MNFYVVCWLSSLIIIAGGARAEDKDFFEKTYLRLHKMEEQLINARAQQQKAFKTAIEEHGVEDCKCMPGLPGPPGPRGLPGFHGPPGLPGPKGEKGGRYSIKVL